MNEWNEWREIKHPFVSIYLPSIYWIHQSVSIEWFCGLSGECGMWKGAEGRVKRTIMKESSRINTCFSFYSSQGRIRIENCCKMKKKPIKHENLNSLPFLCECVLCCVYNSLCELWHLTQSKLHWDFDMELVWLVGWLVGIIWYDCACMYVVMWLLLFVFHWKSIK